MGGFLTGRAQANVITRTDGDPGGRVPREHLDPGLWRPRRPGQADHALVPASTTTPAPAGTRADGAPAAPTDSTGPEAPAGATPRQRLRHRDSGRTRGASRNRPTPAAPTGQ